MTTVLNLESIIALNREQFYQLCLNNPDLNLERNLQGELIIMSPVGGISGKKEANLIADLIIWNRQKKLGEVFSSSTIFSLPQGGERSPDVAWVSLEKWEKLTEKEREGFPPICPDFVIELRSPSDRLTVLREKMHEYLANGCQLAWLIDRQNQQVEVYTPGQAPHIQSFPTTLDGGDLLPGLVIEMGML